MQVTSYNSTSQHKFLFKLENSEQELSMSVKEHMLLTISRKIIASSKQTIIKQSLVHNKILNIFTKKQFSA